MPVQRSVSTVAPSMAAKGRLAAETVELLRLSCGRASSATGSELPPPQAASSRALKALAAQAVAVR